MATIFNDPDYQAGRKDGAGNWLAPCPQCGHCPHCGRGSAPAAPWPGYPRPYIGDPMPGSYPKVICSA